MARTTYSLMVSRVRKGKRQKDLTQWLPGESRDLQELKEEALSLLADPRDDIHHILLWNNKWKRFESKAWRRTDADAD